MTDLYNNFKDGNSMIVKKKTLIDKFAETMGVEKSTEILDKTIAALGFEAKDQFLEEEAFKILDHIKTEEGLVATVACYVSAAIISANMMQKDEFI